MYAVQTINPTHKLVRTLCNCILNIKLTLNLGSIITSFACLLIIKKEEFNPTQNHCLLFTLGFEVVLLLDDDLSFFGFFVFTF